MQLNDFSLIFFLDKTPVLVIFLLDLLRSMKLRVRADYTLLFAIVVVRVCIILAKINILINIDVLKYYIYFIRLLREKKRKRTFFVG